MYETDPEVRKLIDDGTHNVAMPDRAPPENIDNGNVRVGGLKSGQQYRIRYYSTVNGKELNKYSHVRTSIAGRAAFRVPPMTTLKDGMPKQDFAYTVIQEGPRVGWLGRWWRAMSERRKLRSSFGVS